MNAKYKIIAIRHGISVYNEDHRKYKDIQYDYHYADTILLPIGISRTQELCEQINQSSIKYIFVSPLYRALQTCKYLLESHPRKKEIRVIVEPNLNEYLGNANDFPNHSLAELKNIFTDSGINIDFSLKESVGNYFYLDYVIMPYQQELKESIPKDEYFNSEFIK